MTLGGRSSSATAPSPVSDSSAVASSCGEPSLSDFSRFGQRLRRRYGAELQLLAPGTPDRARMAQTYQALRDRRDDTATALRILRQVVMERLLRLDCDEQAPLSLVTGVVTELAELALDIACTQARSDLDAAHGAPLGPDGKPTALWEIGRASCRERVCVPV